MGLISWLGLGRTKNLEAEKEADYRSRLEREIESFGQCSKVHELPGIFHYWSNKYLVPLFKPFGFGNPQEFFCKYLTRICSTAPQIERRFVSVGAGNCEVDVDIVARLINDDVENFRLECLDINPAMLERGKEAAAEKGVVAHMEFSVCDINSWEPKRKYDAVIAIQCLHHFVELEVLFDKTHSVLDEDGYFLTDDMIGRNGHMRWPEAQKVVEELWKELPERFKYNHQLKRLEKKFVNWDCSTEGFEGIRAQDILPLLLERFHFEFFLAFGNIIDPFVDRCFGHNFDPDSASDRSFIDRVQALDAGYIDAGKIKPTHMVAAMKIQPTKTTVYKHMTPEFCIRWP